MAPIDLRSKECDVTPVRHFQDVFEPFFFFNTGSNAILDKSYQHRTIFSAPNSFRYQLPRTSMSFLRCIAFRVTMVPIVTTRQSSVEVAKWSTVVGGSQGLPTRATPIETQPFGIWLCRRLRFSIPLTWRNCRCGRRLDKFGNDRAACSRVGVGKSALECAAAQTCFDQRVHPRLRRFNTRRKHKFLHACCIPENSLPDTLQEVMSLLFSSFLQ